MWRLGGIIGIGVSLLGFLMGAIMFSAQIYEIGEAEKEKVLEKF